jgi:hypothetical protein
MRHFTIIIATIIFTSCNDSKGYIDKRDGGCVSELKNSKKVFLVNKNRNKIYQFTCKITETINDTGKVYTTIIRTLDPGDELYLGCSESISEQLYGSKDTTEIQDKIEDEKSFQQILKTGKKTKGKHTYDYEKSKNYNPFEEFNTSLGTDTIINGKKLKIITHKTEDYSVKLPRKLTKYEYEITGEVELKEKPE